MRPVAVCFAMSLTLALINTLPAAPLPDDSHFAHVDNYGDPLPEGAIARLGTTRFRHGGRIHASVFSRDGKTLTTYGEDDIIRTWEVPSGRQIREVRRVGAKPERIICATFSVDGATLGIGCGHFTAQDCSALVVETRTGTEARRFTMKDTCEVTSLAFSRDGSSLAVGDRAGKLCVWNPRSGKQLFSIKDDSVPVIALAFSRDDDVLAAGTTGDTLTLYDAGSGKQIRDFGRGGQFGSTYGAAIAFSPHGDVIATSTDPERFSLLDLEKGNVRRAFTIDMLGKDLHLNCMAFSPDGSTIAVGTDEGAASFWDPVGGASEVRIALNAPICDPGEATHCGMLFSPDGKMLATWGRGNTVRLWDTTNGRELTYRDENLAEPHALSFSPDSRLLAFAARSDLVRIWEPRTARPPARVTPCEGKEVPSIAFAPDGHWLACANGHQSKLLERKHPGVARYAVPSWEQLSALTLEEPAKALAFAPDGHALSAASSSGKEGMLVTWPRESGLFSGESWPGPVNCLAYSSDGNFLVTGGSRLSSVELEDNETLIDNAGEIRFWNPKDRKELRRISCACRQIDGISLLPDNRMVLALDRDHQLLWIEITSGRERRRRQQVWSAALSPDGHRLATGSSTGDVSLYDLRTNKLLRTFSGHRGPIRSLAFSPDNKLLASASSDTTVLVWDLENIHSTPTNAFLSQDDLERLWLDLDRDAPRAADAMATLADSPDQMVSLLRKQLSPIIGSDRRISQLIHDLDADDFTTRQSASHELALVGEAAIPALRNALDYDPSTEVKARIESLLAKISTIELLAPDVRTSRALELLESTNTPDSRKLLQQLASGDTKAWLTQEAQSSLDRHKSQ